MYLDLVLQHSHANNTGKRLLSNIEVVCDFENHLVSRDDQLEIAQFSANIILCSWF